MSPDFERFALPFEEPLIRLEKKLEGLGGSASKDQKRRLEEKVKELERKIYKDISPWEEVQLARHPLRPTTKDYIDLMCDEFEELHGDRNFMDDKAIIGGIAKMGERSLFLIGHEKGRTTKQKIERNFGMASPEGFRKSLRLMRMAEKFSLPIVLFVDTPGAYPGVGAEERGQPQAIAENLKSFFDIETPILVLIIGEGGSGGALALAVGDRVYMMEHAVYSVISPEGCAAILWKSKEKAPQAAESLRLTSKDCLEFGVIDGIIEEVSGAAHRNPQGNADKLKGLILKEIGELELMTPEELLAAREKKYIGMGIFKA
ncbi:acetyl-CoA carboxylase carboxyl transferase subunit alpha [bacterium]|nr:MAG: acetyl-CoA carboxylase carboxyl transferase subunit alpha [bacterium]